MNPKGIIRKMFGARNNESFRDALDRHKTKIKKKIYRQKFSVEDLKQKIEDCGISDGDTVMVHSSWRNFFNFDGTPEDVISVLEDIVGKNGTIIMPCFGADRNQFDIKNSPSAAGVLSETFRKKA